VSLNWIKRIPKGALMGECHGTDSSFWRSKRASPRTIARKPGTNTPKPGAEPCERDFLQFSSRNSVRWKYGLDYTLTNGVGKQGKTGRPHASKSRFSGKEFQKFGGACPICQFQTTPPHDGRTHRSQKKKSPFSAAELKEKGLVKA
jgi:hypothetical protein